jgi:hypothetical protein
MTIPVTSLRIMPTKRTLILGLPVIALMVTSAVRLQRVPQVKAQTAATPALTVLQLATGIMIVGHSSGAVSYCSSLVSTAPASNGGAALTLQGKCKSLGFALPLPVANWTTNVTPSGSQVQFVNLTTGEVVFCAAAEVTGLGGNPSGPPGTALGSCTVQTTAPK